MTQKQTRFNCNTAVHSLHTMTFTSAFTSA